MAYVHHPDPKHVGTEQVGARTVVFEDGRAEVTIPTLLARYRRAGYVITEERRRPVAAGHADVEPVVEAAGVVDD